jgi:predicted  nucleic acid-binding Zn-ribbon protein
MSDLYIKRKNRKYQGGTGILPKSLFLFVAVFGAIAVWVLKSYGVDYRILIAVPTSLIMLYCGLAALVPLFYIREDQIGDNAYYLGFLFTLSSLAYALWRFQVDKGSDPADIIGSFGVALWSTIVGVALRVFFAQLRQDPHDVEKEARVKIAQTASLLSSDLYQAATTFNTYTRGLQQSVDEVFLKAKEASEKTVNALEALNQRIEQVEAPDSLINRKIDGVFSELETATKKLNGLAGKQTKSVETLLESSDALVQGIQALNGQISNMQQHTGVVSDGAENMQKVTDLVRNLQASLSGLSDGFSNLHLRQTEAIQVIAQHANEMQGQLEKSRKYTAETHDALASMTKTLAEKL